MIAAVLSWWRRRRFADLAGNHRLVIWADALRDPTAPIPYRVIDR